MVPVAVVKLDEPDASLRQAADELAGSGASYAETLSTGMTALIRGLIESVVWLIPACFNRETKETLFDAGDVAFEFGGEVHRVASSARFTAVIKQIYRPKARIVKRTRQGAGADP